MKTLSDVRKINDKRDDLLFTGIEQTSKVLPKDLYNSQLEYYQEVIKPTIARVHQRQLNN